MSTETLRTWRTEIAAEIEALELQVTAARAEHAEAQAAHHEAMNRWVALRDAATRPLRSDEEMAAELYGRLEEERREVLRLPSRRRGAAIAQLKSLTGTLAGRRSALWQIDRALEPFVPTTVSQIGPRRKKAAPVDFDTISMPREAT